MGRNAGNCKYTQRKFKKSLQKHEIFDLQDLKRWASQIEQNCGWGEGGTKTMITNNSLEYNSKRIEKLHKGNPHIHCKWESDALEQPNPYRPRTEAAKSANQSNKNKLNRFSWL